MWVTYPIKCSCDSINQPLLFFALISFYGSWCNIFYLDIILLPWSNIFYLDIISYCRDVTFSTLTWFNYRDVTFFTLISFYCRDGTFFCLDIILLPSSNILYLDIILLLWCNIFFLNTIFLPFTSLMIIFFDEGVISEIREIFTCCMGAWVIGGRDTPRKEKAFLLSRIGV